MRRHDLGDEPSENLSSSTTVDERLGMMWELALQAWAAAGWEIPDYPRSEASVRVLRAAR